MTPGRARPGARILAATLSITVLLGACGAPAAPGSGGASDAPASSTVAVATPGPDGSPPASTDPSRGTGEPPGSPPAPPPGSPPASPSPDALPSASGGGLPSPSASPTRASPSPSASSPSASSPPPTPTPLPSPVPPAVVAHDPVKFGFAAKGMTNEVMAFVTTDQLDYALEAMSWDVVSTVAFFSLEAGRDGSIVRNAGWTAWNSDAMTRLIEKAHANGTKVVISLERFSWSRGQTAVSRDLLSQVDRRARLAREVAAEVVRRGVDGVNIDFEPIPRGQKDEFTHFVKILRRELDRVRPGSQLTFCVVGHHESYDVAGATGPDAADAVYLMGYHYAGTWSERAGSTAPMGGPRYDLVDTVVSLLEQVERHRLIVGVPYYGHVWPTAGSGKNAPTEGEGFDMPVARAVQLAARHGAKYDEVEQVAWVPFRGEPCNGCATRWFQLYFDDARATGYKWAWIKRNKLLGGGVWTIGFEGEPGAHDEAMRAVFLRR